ncbi:hypothetical protein P280DRAFT_553946 [Massarina eburnea CBS 473.64]|uniref:Cyanovirin-N domain-containing protein n=1 Tax=Massarina eburnea CBS 473.64 TaxID=1395130 RepID=A0A6A6RMC3_9PLEO|nr:hypothetical protein P280DRAFT_553946 [Massarina eburnea CBS 473.64]
MSLFSILLFAIIALSAPHRRTGKDVWRFNLTLIDNCANDGSVKSAATLRDFIDGAGIIHSIREDDLDVHYWLNDKNSIGVPNTELSLTLGPMASNEGLPKLQIGMCEWIPTAWIGDPAGDWVCGCRNLGAEDYGMWCLDHRNTWAKPIQCDPERWRRRWYTCWWDRNQI